MDVTRPLVSETSLREGEEDDYLIPLDLDKDALLELIEYVPKSTDYRRGSYILILIPGWERLISEEVTGDINLRDAHISISGIPIRLKLLLVPGCEVRLFKIGIAWISLLFPLLTGSLTVFT
jgi:hypothetical protein